jgi:1-phosphofructokinase
MIITVTLNPSLDRTIEVAELARGSMVRATSTRLDPGGKGVNVARALAAHGIETSAVVPLGGTTGAEITALLQREGIDVCAVPVHGSTRSNVSLVEPDGTVTKINEPGAELTADDLDDVVRGVLSIADGADWVVACGSLPPGVPADFYARLGKLVPVRFAVDTSGPALAAAVEAGPALVKPNRSELAELVGFPIESTADAVRAASEVRASGVDAVLASLGADGAVLVDGQGVRHGDCPVDRTRSAVGAGDAMLAGFLAAGVTGRDPMVEALSWGAAAVRFPGSRMPGPSDVDRSGVRVHAEPHGKEKIK